MITQFPKSTNAEIRAYVLRMENTVNEISGKAQSLGKTEALVYQMGRVSGAGTAVANAMRDFLKELEALEKIAP